MRKLLVLAALPLVGCASQSPTSDTVPVVPHVVVYPTETETLYSPSSRMAAIMYSGTIADWNDDRAWTSTTDTD